MKCARNAPNTPQMGQTDTARPEQHPGEHTMQSKLTLEKQALSVLNTLWVKRLEELG